MTNRTEESNNVARRASRQEEPEVVRDSLVGKSSAPTAGSAAVYDELDYRLMATFPASDATARY